MKDIMNGPDVDRLLESLRTETPEMPADFHASWMKAVREEAAAGAKTVQSDSAASGAETRKDQPGPSRERDAAFGAEKGDRRGTERWARLASLAAALIVLIGGTLATRGRWTADHGAAMKAMKSKSRAADTEAAALPAATEILPAATEILPAATELPLMQAESDAAPAPVMMSAAREAAESDMAAEEAAFEETAAEETAVYDMAAAELEAEETAVEETAADEASFETASARNAAGEAAAADDAPEVMASDTGVSAAAPRPEPEKTGTQGEPEAPEEAEAAETGAKEKTAERAPTFFEDLGQFIAHRWYLPVGAAVLAAVLLRLCRKKTR